MKCVNLLRYSAYVNVTLSRAGKKCFTVCDTIDAPWRLNLT